MFTHSLDKYLSSASFPRGTPSVLPTATTNGQVFKEKKLLFFKNLEWKER